MTLSNPEKANIIAARSALLDYYSDRATSFGGFFLASIFGLLTMMTLVQGIKCNNTAMEYLLIILSIFPVLVFSYMGDYVLKRFSYYADIASKIELGDGTTEGNGLRFYAALDNVACLKKIMDGKYEKTNLAKSMEKEALKQYRFYGKRIINSPWFKIVYWILILVLSIITYVPSLMHYWV